MIIRHFIITGIAAALFFCSGYIIAENDNKDFYTKKIEAENDYKNSCTKITKTSEVKNTEGLAFLKGYKFKKIDSDTNIIINDDISLIITTYFKALK